MQTQRANEYLFSIEEEAPAKIVAIGVGGMGCNAVENMAANLLPGLDLYAVNTDRQALDACVGSRAVQIGCRRTHGRGAGGIPEVGRQCAEDDLDLLRGLLEGAEIAFVIAGMGGGTGTGAAPVVAELAREMGVLTIGTVTTPLRVEGAKRWDRARKGLEEMRKAVDSLVVVENERLNELLEDESASLLKAFRLADGYLLQGVRGMTEIINKRGYINLDIADARNVLQNGGEALIGYGEAAGKDRAVRAAQAALANPLLADASIEGARSLLVNVAGNGEMGLKEAQWAVKTVADQAGKDDQDIFIGIVQDENMGDTLSVTVIATGFQDRGLPDRAGSGKRKTAPPSAVEEMPVVLQPPADPLEVIPSPARSVDGPRISFWAGNGILLDRGRAQGQGILPWTGLAEWATPAYLRRGGCRCLNHESRRKPAKTTAGPCGSGIPS